MSNKSSLKTIMYLLAFVGLVLIATSLILVKLNLGGSLTSAFQLIANVIAYSMVAFFSFFYVRSKRNIGFLITWIVCVVIVVVMMILI